MLKKFLTLLFVAVSSTTISAQIQEIKKPKLLIGIVIDQMRYDYLYKYSDKYSEGGFKRLLREGYNFKNTHFNYIPTVTAAGHASIYTGTTPSMHGIIGNTWYDRIEKDNISNVNDYDEITIGSAEPNDVGRSPKKILTNTIGDQLRLGSNFTSKVVSVSLKDRGAVLPGGHAANAAYWHDWQTSPGYFVSSSYYMDQLPKWVTDFNQSGRADQELDTVWNTYYPIEEYTESAADSNGYERVLGGKNAPVFPYDFRRMRIRYRQLKAEYQLLWVSPGGNTLLTEFAKEAIKHEALGEDEITDLLAISYSVPDVIGHTFGPQSIEMEDIYIRLDLDIKNLLEFLDSQIGKDQYTLFLTADHGAIQVASYLDDYKMPAGIARINEYQDTLIEYMQTIYGNGDFIESFSGEHVYFNRQAVSEKKINLSLLQEDVANFLTTLDGVNGAFSANHLRTEEYSRGVRKLIQNGFHPKRSGDIMLNYDPGFIQSSDPLLQISDIKGTTHGSAYAYDTHVPLIWFGHGINKGSSVRDVFITDISPSIAMMLDLQIPSGNSGSPLVELFK